MIMTDKEQITKNLADIDRMCKEIDTKYKEWVFTGMPNPNE